MAFCVVIVAAVVVIGQHSYYRVHQIRLVKHRALGAAKRFHFSFYITEGVYLGFSA